MTGPDPGNGLIILPGKLDPAAQAELLDEVRALIAMAPLFVPRMPRSDRAFSVRMSNAGTLGWVSDKKGYRYQENHPVTGAPWPVMPAFLSDLWESLTGGVATAECCLINYYSGAGAKMGLHRDQDEEEPNAPVVSLSLGDTALFRIGGLQRRDPTRSFRLASGDVLILKDDARHAFHGVDRIIAGSSRLLAEGGRFNLTLRRVRPANREEPETASAP